MVRSVPRVHRGRAQEGAALEDLAASCRIVSFGTPLEADRGWFGNWEQPEADETLGDRKHAHTHTHTTQGGGMRPE